MFAVHSIEYDSLESFLYVFAALQDGSKWLSWDDVKDLAAELEIPTVPVITRRQVYYMYSSIDNVLMVMYFNYCVVSLTG